MVLLANGSAGGPDGWPWRCPARFCRSDLIVCRSRSMAVCCARSAWTSFLKAAISSLWVWGGDRESRARSATLETLSMIASSSRVLQTDVRGQPCLRLIRPATPQPDPPGSRAARVRRPRSAQQRRTAGAPAQTSSDRLAQLRTSCDAMNRVSHCAEIEPSAQTQHDRPQRIAHDQSAHRAAVR